jgi:tRNA dimethylallyltransferase
MADDFSNVRVLTGPTGAGKSALALEVAEKLDAEIIGMDSMTLYRRMDIGTAKPTPDDRRRVVHHLVDVLDPWESASVAWWLERAGKCVRDIESRGKRALFVGGTPLYLKALLHGLFEGPPADRDLRRRLEVEAKRVGATGLHRRLAEVDPETAARLHPNDLRRIVRALEVWEQTGRPISAWQRQWGARVRDSESRPRCCWIDRPRDELYQRINSRVRSMIAAGWVEEAGRLRQMPLPLSREAEQALGYSELFQFLDGRRDLEATIGLIQTRSRQFAKRQLTWFRHLTGCTRVPITGADADISMILQVLR